MKSYFRKVLALLILVCCLLNGCMQNQKILTHDIDEIKTVTLLAGTDETILSADIVKKIYYDLQQINVKQDQYDQSADPMFILIFEYSDGSKDIIRSTENGRFVYRNLLSNNKWIGGKTDKLYLLISK